MLFIDSQSVKGVLNPPLLPIVAISSFLTNQWRSLLDHPYKDDATIQQLYDLAKRILRFTTNDGRRRDGGTAAGSSHLWPIAKSNPG
ncbi:hypothetical protein BCR42DRAFT_420473, partial [Absidia repens]